MFARVGDRLTFTPSDRFDLEVRGANAQAAGELADNLVLKAAHALAARVDGLRLGRFALDKNLPVAAGLGGGSADAAAALRLLAHHNDLALDDPKLFDAARQTGADVPVCLASMPRMMRGIGDVLAPPLDLPPFPAALVNPGVAVATRDVFAALGLAPGREMHAQDPTEIPADPAALFHWLADRPNDLQEPALSLLPVIAEVIEALGAQPGCRLARMSGSGATCFGLFESEQEVAAAARQIEAKHPGWWVRATTFG